MKIDCVQDTADEKPDAERDEFETIECERESFSQRTGLRLGWLLSDSGHVGSISSLFLKG